LRQAAKVMGQTFQAGDFTVHIGHFEAGSTRARIIEIGYAPSSSMQDAFPLLQEFLQILLPSQSEFVVSNHSVSDETTPPPSLSVDIAQQYFDILMQNKLL